ncbi:hypothetical protein [Methanothrix soehngenii]|uniref:hypothetical protein n=1 Tax=Methanothrix soehngenii TaxID=2223 RepID=UPI00300C3307
MCSFLFHPRSDEGVWPTGAARAPGMGGWYQGLALASSGRVQEKACILGVPGVTLRDNTEGKPWRKVQRSCWGRCSADG